MDKLDQDTTVYFEPANCSQASMAPECTVILLSHSSLLPMHNACIHFPHFEYSSCNSETIPTLDSSGLKHARYELANFAETHSQNTGTQLSKYECCS